MEDKVSKTTRGVKMERGGGQGEGEREGEGEGEKERD